MRICVIIPAAGKGERYGPTSKLDEDLGGRPLLLRTVELFTKRDEVGQIIVAGPPDKLDEFKFRYGDRLSFHGVRIVAGGRVARWETVRNALEAAPDDCTHIAIHDAARPATPGDVLDRLFEAARKFDAVAPGVPVSATLKRVSPETETAAEVDPIAAAILGDAGHAANPAQSVIETIDRTNLVEIQTPQIFKADLLRRAYGQSEQTLNGVTDDAQVVERFGEAVHVILGDSRNLKVTTPADLELIRTILGVKPPADRPAHKRF